MAPKIPVIAIVGRPNVGKSTLFNRVLGERRAIVEDIPGVTRDRNYALVERFDVTFLLVDTGGIGTVEENEMDKLVAEQTLIAAEEADVIVALFDGADGCQDSDKDIVGILRRYDKPVYYVVNKCDGQEQALRTADFYQLGLDVIHDCSALHGRRVQLLFEEILSKLPNYQALLSSTAARRNREDDAAEIAREAADLDEEAESQADLEPDEELRDNEEPEIGATYFAPVYLPGETEETEHDYDRSNRLLEISESVPRIEPEVEEEFWREDDQANLSADKTPKHIETIRVAIVGRPNVGKSTMLNTLTGETRAITSPVAGTTRDTLDMKLRREGQDFVIVDTAGLRKKARIDDAVEHYSAIRSIGALSESDVAVVVIDATAGPTDQDTKIVGLAHEQGVGIVIAINKWDLVEKDHRTVHSFTKSVREAFKFAPYAPIVFVSALSGRRCPKVISTVRDVAYERAKRVSTGKLNQVLKKALLRFAPPPYRGNPIKLYYGVQVDVSPPRFALFFNYPRSLHFSFLRFLKNEMREEFGFDGTDIKLYSRKRS